MAVQVDIWSDVICPFCFIGEKRLTAASQRSGISAKIIWHAYELSPEAPETHELPLVKLIADKYGMSPDQAVNSQVSIAQAAKEVGIDFNWEIAKPGNTFNCHRLIRYASLSGKGNQAQEAFMTAYMTRGLAIGTRAVQRHVALEVGLDAQGVDKILDSDEYAQDVRDDEAFAIRRLHVRGVPLFIFNGQIALSGAQPAEAFQDALKQSQDLGLPEEAASAKSSKSAPMCGDDGVCAL